MASRLELQSELEELLGSRNVYYQPPASVKMNYPAIVYSRSDIENVHADNLAYRQLRSYKVTVIDKDPESKIVDKISQLRYCSFNQHYTADNLNHDVFILFY